MSTLFNSLGDLNPIAYIIISLILLVFIVSVIVNLMTRRRYVWIRQDLAEGKSVENFLFASALLNSIIEEYKAASINNKGEVNTQAIIEKGFNNHMRKSLLGERYIKNAVSLLVILGLFGTFLGLTLAVGELAQLLVASEGSDWMDILNSVGSGLLFSLQGMAIAFVTSLFGIGCSVILTVLNIMFNVQDLRESIMVDIEEYLDNHVAATVSTRIETESDVMIQTLKDTFKDFAGKMGEALNTTVDAFTQNLSEVAAGIGDTTVSLDKAVEKFQMALDNFGEDIRDLTEFNINLRNNIERMDVNFIKMTEAIKERTIKETTMLKMSRQMDKIEGMLKDKDNR